MTKLRDALVILILIAVLTGIIQVNRLLWQIDRTVGQIEQTVEIAHQTMEKVGFAAEAQIQSTAILSKSSDNLARTVINIDGTIRDVRRVTLPTVNQILSDLRTQTVPNVNELLSTVNRLTVKTTDGVSVILDDTDAAIRDIRTLLQSPEIKSALGNLGKVSESSAGIAQNVELSSSEIRQALPEILAGLKALESETGRVSKETADFIAKLNRPLTKKEKFVNWLVRILSVGLPVAIQKY